MRYAATPLACRLTGLTTDKLREWTSRRALIVADVPPVGKGSAARYSWQTILVLRLAVALRERFHLELQAHRALFEALQRGLRGKSFIALWGQSLAVFGEGGWAIVETSASALLEDDAIVIRLDPHLTALSEGFALPNPANAPGQLELFTVQTLDAGSTTTPTFKALAPASLTRRSA